LTRLEAFRAKKETLGRFILASNQCDHSLLSNHNILKQYKEQSGVESSFKFIKNSAFELDSFFLKNPARMTALMMIMTLCLMVYNFAQAHLRQCLMENNETLPNQLGKPVQNPTMKWVAEFIYATMPYSAQFFTLYVAFLNLWRYLSLYLYFLGMRSL
jgi:transposase